jgi:PAS domain S-box-containing protein/putative nucleotidyltransferase with HDIG domain
MASPKPDLLHVLVLEDRPADADLILYELKRSGFTYEHRRVDNEPNYLEALEQQVDIILADYSMPQFTAMQALRLLQDRNLDIPFIVVTGTISEEAAVDTMKQGASDYLLKDRLGRLGQAVERALEQKRLRDARRQSENALRLSEDKFSKAFYISPDAISITRLQDGRYIEINNGFMELTGFTQDEVVGKSGLELNMWANLDESNNFYEQMRLHGEVRNLEGVLKRQNGGVWIGLISARMIEVNDEPCIMTVARDITERKRAEIELQRANLDLAEAYDATIEGWSRVLDLRDRETEGHTQRVTEVTLKLARALGISGEDLIHLRRGALLHDIGKMGVPDQILQKPGPLTEEEWAIMRRHPEYAYAMLYPIAYLRPALDIPYAHHERWDGTGYPRGLAGEQIPLPARIFAIVDVWDALCSDRPYRKGCTEKEVLLFIQDHAEVYFDPRLVNAFLKFFEQGLFKDTGTQRLLDSK